jgi:hypothetical protein
VKQLEAQMEQMEQMWNQQDENWETAMETLKVNKMILKFYLG